MPDRRITLAENGRTGTRGVLSVSNKEFFAYQREDEDLSYVIDMAPILGAATISSVTRAANGPTVSGTSNTTTTMTQRLKGYGYVDVKASLSTSEVHTVRINIRQRQEDVKPTDYGFVS